MRADDLTTAQADALRGKIGEHLGYLTRLKRRLDEQAFPVDDPLRLRIEQAHDALHRLFIELHYRSCPGGVARKPNDVG